MAAFTFATETTFVNVIFFVAVRTHAGWAVMESRTLVTVSALHCGMAGTQRKPCLRMIELRALPSGNPMAIVAIDSEFALVHIILQMAGNAGFRSRAILLPGSMAVTAFDALVQAEQNIVSERVIELPHVQTDDVGLASLVLGVTVVTGATRLQPSVVTAVRRDIRGDFFMAPETQLDLGPLVKRDVAFSATGLDVGMALYYFAGHHQCLKIAC